MENENNIIAFAEEVERVPAPQAGTIYKLSDEELLEKMLGVEDEQYQDVYISRFGDYFRVRSVSNDLYHKLEKRCTYFVKNKRTHELDEKVDKDKLSALLVAEACVRPSFRDPKLLAKYKTNDAVDVVNKRLNIGEITILSAAIMEASGFYDGVEEAKN